MLDSRVESGLGIRSFDFRANRSHRSFLVSDLSDSLIFGEQPEQFAPIARQKRGNERESVRGGADLPLKPQAPPPPIPRLASLASLAVDRHVGGRGRDEYLARGPAPPPSPPHGDQLTACGA